MASKFKKGDNVIIISGSDRGKIGLINAVIGDRVIVSGVNFATIHKKPTQSSSGQVVKVEKSIHVSNISHIEDGKIVKVGFKIDPSEGKSFAKKSRFSKKTNKKIG